LEWPAAEQGDEKANSKNYAKLLALQAYQFTSLIARQQ
jgi:hypothetical protein